MGQLRFCCFPFCCDVAAEVALAPAFGRVDVWDVGAMLRGWPTIVFNAVDSAPVGAVSGNDLAADQIVIEQRSIGGGNSVFADESPDEFDEIRREGFLLATIFQNGLKAPCPYRLQPGVGDRCKFL